MRTGLHRHQTGFTMLGNMISVLLLSLGAVGIALSTATTVKINVDNLQRSMALNAASTALEALYITSDADSGASLRSSIDAFLPSEVPGSESVGYSVTSNPDENGVDRDTFIVKVLAAVDAAGTDVLTTAAPYVSPVTIAVQVDYQGVSGKNVTGVEEIKTVKASYTYVLPST